MGRNVDRSEVMEILEAHSAWLNHQGGARADLHGACLRELDLQGVNFENALLRGTDFSWSNLKGATLNSAQLQGTDFSWSNLKGATLNSAQLQAARLEHTNLQGADLRNAFLVDAQMRGADLTDAKLPACRTVLPSKGSFTGWKKVVDSLRNFCVLELLITGERTGSLVGPKCRCSAAKVVSAYWKGERLTEGTWFSMFRDRPPLVYRLGEEVTESCYDPDIRVECAPGIHFFLERREAEGY